MEDKKVVAGEAEKARQAEEKVYSIEAIIKDWADEKAKVEKAKTGCLWVDLDYAKPETKKTKNQARYQADEKFNMQVGDVINLEDALALDNKKKKLNDKEEVLRNKKASSTKIKTTSTFEVTRNLTYTLNCGLKLSANFTANALFAQVQAGIELDLGVTREKGTQIRTSVQQEIDRDVPGKHEAVCRVEAYGTPYKHAFTVAVELKGKVPVLFKNHVDYKDFNISKLSKNNGGHKLQFIPIADIFQDLKNHNKLPKDLTCTIEHGKVICVIKGEYIVEKVTTEIIMEEEKPLAGASVVVQPANTNQSQGNKPVTNPASSIISVVTDVDTIVPERIALDPVYQPVIQQRMLRKANDTQKLIDLIQLLKDPALKDQQEFIKTLIIEASNDKIDPNYQAQLDWVEKHPDKVHLLPSKTELKRNIVGLEVRQTTTSNPTGPSNNNNLIDEKEESSSESSEHKPKGP